MNQLEKCSEEKRLERAPVFYKLAVENDLKQTAATERMLLNQIVKYNLDEKENTEDSREYWTPGRRR